MDGPPDVDGVLLMRRVSSLFRASARTAGATGCCKSDMRELGPKGRFWGDLLFAACAGGGIDMI